MNRYRCGKGAKTSDGESFRTETPPERPAAGRLIHRRARVHARSALQTHRHGTRKTHGWMDSRSGARRPAVTTPREEQSSWQSRPVHPIGPMRKSYSGAGRTHGTMRSRGQTPGAAATNLWSHRHKRCRPRDDETRGGKWRNGRWVRDVERRRHPRTEAKLRRVLSESHGRRRDFDGPGQVAITAQAAGPSREPPKIRTRMTRGGGVEEAIDPRRTSRRNALKTARANRSGPGSPASNQRRSGMVRRPATSGRYGATGER